MQLGNPQASGVQLGQIEGIVATPTVESDNTVSLLFEFEDWDTNNSSVQVLINASMIMAQPSQWN